MLNFLSLCLGLASWGMGIAAVCRRRFGACAFTSLAFAGGALVVQFWEIGRRAELADWSALADTCGALARAAAVLTAMTVLLNGTALLRSRKK